MRRLDKAWLALLAVAAVALWIGVVRHWDATLGLEAEAPVAIALPLFILLGRPWRWADAPAPISLRLAIVGSLLYLAGMAAFSTTIALLGWNIGLWAWLGARLTPDSRARAWSLAALPVMAWPWLKMDAHVVEVWLRHVDAWAMQQALILLDIPAAVVNTMVCTPHASFRLVDECAGLNMLHGIVIVGAVLAFYQRHLTPVWRTLLKVAVMALVANCLRIVAVGVLGLLWFPDAADGPLHSVLGVLAVLLLCGAASTPERVPRLRRLAAGGPVYDLPSD